MIGCLSDITGPGPPMTDRKTSSGAYEVAASTCLGFSNRRTNLWLFFIRSFLPASLFFMQVIRESL